MQARRKVAAIWLSLLCLANSLHSGEPARTLQNDEHSDVRYLQCKEPGCNKGVEGKVLAFSALHDVILKEVAIFVDIAIPGSDDPEQIGVNCLYWSGEHQNVAPTKVPGTGHRIFDNKHTYAPYVVKCSDPMPALRGTPKWVGFEFSGADTQVRLLVEQVSLEAKGTIGACNGAVNSDQFDMLYSWLHFYTELGVEGINIYYTNQTVQWNKQSSIATATDVPKPFNFPGVTWFHYEHLEIVDRFLYSQTTIYNDCVYRLRHTYKYLLMFDMDEFLVIRDSRFSRPGGLRALLTHAFPPNYAAVGVYRYAYREDCHQGEPINSDVYHERFTHRLKETESQTVLQSKRYADKLIVKPDRVDIFYMHFLGSVRPGYVFPVMNTQPSMVFLKHLRTYGQDCSELTDELPFDQD